MNPKNQRIRTGLLALVFVLSLLMPRNVAGGESVIAQTTQPAFSGMEFALTSIDSGWLRFGDRVFTGSNGTDWQEVPPSMKLGDSLADIYFIDSRKASALTVSFQREGWQLNLLKTTNSGLSWQEQALTFPDQLHDYLNLPFGGASMQWQDDDTGQILIRQATSSNFSLGVFLITSDGGKSWLLTEPPAAEEFVFLDENLGFMRDPADPTRLYQTQDGGNSWQSIQPLAAISALDEPQHLGLPTKWQGSDLILPVWIDDGGIGSELVFLTTSQKLLNNADGEGWLQFAGAINSKSWQVYFGSDLAFTQLSSLDGKRLWLGLSGSACEQELLAGEADLPLSTLTCANKHLLLSSVDGGAHWEQIDLPFEVLPSAVGSIQQGLFQNMLDVDQRLNTVQWVQIYQGQGFDACEIPSLFKLQTWFNSSPYQSVNLYIGGISRACDNDALTAAYLQQMFNQGWRFIPTWVGHQAPCTTYKNRFSPDPQVAYAQGVDNANQARAKLMELGLTNPDGSGSVVYDDLEYFPYSTECSAAAKAFVRGWTTRLQQLGIIPGLYASSWNLEQNHIYDLQPAPYAVWIAEWYAVPGYRPDVTVWDVDWLDDIYWPNHQRVYQYSGSHNETWGGVTINIDNNVLDGLVAAPYGADLIAPVTAYSESGTIGISPWYKTPVTVTLTATDNSVGVKHTYYRINSGAWQLYSGPFAVTGSGQKTINYVSVDRVNNWETPKSASFYVDSEPPINPWVTNPGCQAYNGVPQAWCNDPWFTWAGAYDLGVGLNPTDTYEYYWGTNQNAASGTRTTATQFNPPAIPAGVPYYLRIRTQDRHGLWSAWQTIYTLIYDTRFTHQLWLPRVAK